MSADHKNVKLFATTGTEYLADQVEQELQHRLPKHAWDYSVERGRHELSTFSNENIVVQVDNVRDHIALVLHTQAPPVNDGLIELLAMLDAINNAHPRQTFVVFPYMPYSRSDRKNRPRISVMGQRLPEILNKVMGVHRVMLLEPHNGQIKQYFSPTADEVPMVPLLVNHVRNVFLKRWEPNDCTLVFADAGAAKRFEHVPASLGLDPTYIYKTRADHSESPMINAVMGNVRGRHCFILDDEILTGGTVVRDAETLKDEGAASVTVLAVHGVLADQRLGEGELMRKLASCAVDEFVITDSIPVTHKVSLATNFTVIPAAPLIAEACARLIVGDSLSDMHRSSV